MIWVAQSAYPKAHHLSQSILKYKRAIAKKYNKQDVIEHSESGDRYLDSGSVTSLPLAVTALTDAILGLLNRLVDNILTLTVNNKHTQRYQNC